MVVFFRDITKGNSEKKARHFDDIIDFFINEELRSNAQYVDYRYIDLLAGEENKRIKKMNTQ